MDKKNARDFAVNRKATHDYFVDERFEAGVVLEGWEAKTIRSQGISLDGAFVQVKEGEVFLNNAYVKPLDTVASYTRPDARRARKLLMHGHEIAKLIGKVERRGMTLIPLRVYAVKGRVKVEVGLCRGKKLHDKRESLKEQDLKRDVARAMAER